MSRKPWTDLAVFYDLDGRPGFVVPTLGKARHLDPENRWPAIEPAALAKGTPVSLDTFNELRGKYASDFGPALVQNLNLNVWLEEMGLIGPPP